MDGIKELDLFLAECRLAGFRIEKSPPPPYRFWVHESSRMDGRWIALGFRVNGAFGAWRPQEELPITCRRFLLSSFEFVEAQSWEQAIDQAQAWILEW